jgi:lambda repressor-like predicted transcriptional regulator
MCKVMYGESNPSSKLTKTKMRYMRWLRHKGWTLAALVQKYGVSIATVHRIVHYVTWREV